MHEGPPCARLDSLYRLPCASARINARETRAAVARNLDSPAFAGERAAVRTNGAGDADRGANPHGFGGACLPETGEQMREPHQVWAQTYVRSRSIVGLDD
jgi:hypothetical protein